MDSERAGPALRVVRGEPTAEELAALTAVLSAVQTRSILNASTPHPAQPARGRLAGPGRADRRAAAAGPRRVAPLVRPR